MRATRDLAEHRIFRIGAQRPERCLRARAQEPPRRAVGESRLADALRPDQQPGVVQPPALQRLEKRVFGALETLHARGVTRMNRVAQGASRRLTVAQIATSTASIGWVASITTQRSASTRAMARKASRSRLWKATPLASNRVSA